MNKLSFCEPVWLASDIHLGPDNPKTSHAFYRFLAHARDHAGALLLLGDIFDVWIGDDWIRRPPPWLDLALQQLELTGRTIPLWILGGNRDFLIGEDLARHLHARLLRGQCLLEIAQSENPERPDLQGSTATSHRSAYLLAHGDEFCTKDLKYQRFRRIVRTPLVQSCFLTLPLYVRNRIANSARRASQRTERDPYDASYDVQNEALAHALNVAGTTTCVHGHTHRPGHYFVRPDAIDIKSSANRLDRWVLPDWESDHLNEQELARGGWIQIDRHGLTAHNLNDLDPQKQGPANHEPRARIQKMK